MAIKTNADIRKRLKQQLVISSDTNSAHKPKPLLVRHPDMTCLPRLPFAETTTWGHCWAALSCSGATTIPVQAVLEPETWLLCKSQHSCRQTAFKLLFGSQLLCSCSQPSHFYRYILQKLLLLSLAPSLSICMHTRLT